MDFDTAQENWVAFVNTLYDAMAEGLAKLEEFGLDVINHAERYYNDITE